MILPQGIPHYISNTAPSAPPAPINMTAQERYFMDNFQTILGYLLDNEESNHEEVAGINQGTRTNSFNSQVLNPFELPVIHLFKTNSEGHRAQFDILPEDFKPKTSRLPYPFMGPLELAHLDIEATYEMLLKISLSGIIKDDPNIDVERLINHFYGFYYRS